MPDSRITELSKKTFRERMRFAGPVEGWAEYQAVLQYLRSHGKELQPTARLILLALIGHEAHTHQVVHETGACHYAVNKGLAELTKRGLLLRESFALGRFKHSFYRIDKDFLDAQCNRFAGHPHTGLLNNEPVIKEENP
jgi:hypothetical protein